MKNLLLIFLFSFILIGCASKQQSSSFKNKPVIFSKPIIQTEKELEEIKNEPIQEAIEEDKEGLNKVAILYPSKVVGKYAKSTISAVTAYLVYNNKEFEVIAFDTKNEQEFNILNQVREIENRGFKKVIALFTKQGFDVLNKTASLDFAKIYYPLINKNEVKETKSNFIFGGISYKEQFELLKTLSSKNSAMFYVKSYLGSKLKNYYDEMFLDNRPKVIEIDSKINRYKYIMNDKNLLYNTIVLNTPIIKSSIVLSQLTAYEIDPVRILSTQLNFDPLLVKLTQEKDRKNLFVVNSISNVNDFIEEYADLLGADVVYNWVDYSSLVGIEYLISIDSYESERVTQTQIVDNQVEYLPSLYRGTSYGFKKVEDINSILEETNSKILKMQENR